METLSEQIQRMKATREAMENELRSMGLGDQLATIADDSREYEEQFDAGDAICSATYGWKWERRWIVVNVIDMRNHDLAVEMFGSRVLETGDDPRGGFDGRDLWY